MLEGEEPKILSQLSNNTFILYGLILLTVKQILSIYGFEDYQELVLLCDISSFGVVFLCCMPDCVSCWFVLKSFTTISQYGKHDVMFKFNMFSSPLFLNTNYFVGKFLLV